MSTRSKPHVSLVHPEMTVEALIPILDRTEPCPMPEGWQSWPVAAKAHRVLMRQLIRRMPSYPGGFAGRGIVICAGGSRYFTGAYVCARMLRFLGCRLPIQFWYLGDCEMDDQMRTIASALGVVCVDAEKMRTDYPARILNGWELKPYALLHSQFKEVLLLDADNVPVVDPAYLFDLQEFRNCGAVFWPDLGRLSQDRLIWEICDVVYRDEPEFESGQILVDKTSSWRALLLTMWMNEHSDYYFAHIHGDKETFHMAWHALEMRYAMPSKGIDQLDTTLCQHDFAGRRIFQHRNMDKWSLDGSNRRIRGFHYEDQCRAALADLRRSWSGDVEVIGSNRGQEGEELKGRILAHWGSSDFQRHPAHDNFRGPVGCHQRPDEPELFEEKYRMFWSVTRTVQPKSMVELGVLDGRSADAMLSGCPDMEYLGLDRWQYDEDFDGERWVSEIFKDRGYKSAKLVRCDFRDLSSLEKAEFVHVDGDHDYHNERRDLELALTASPKWILIDDYRGQEGEFAAATEFCDKWAKLIIATITIEYCHGGGLLVKLNKSSERVLEQIEKERSAEERLTGTVFLYRRVGFDERRMQLRRGGLIGEGSADCERSWRIDLDHSGTAVLTIAGRSGPTFRARWHQQFRNWKGQWLDHERMPVELLPL
jgi:Mannosyltransferase putative